MTVEEIQERLIKMGKANVAEAIPLVLIKFNHVTPEKLAEMIERDEVTHVEEQAYGYLWRNQMQRFSGLLNEYQL